MLSESLAECDSLELLRLAGGKVPAESTGELGRSRNPYIAAARREGREGVRKGGSVEEMERENGRRRGRN